MRQFSSLLRPLAFYTYCFVFGCYYPSDITTLFPLLCPYFWSPMRLSQCFLYIHCPSFSSENFMFPPVYISLELSCICIAQCPGCKGDAKLRAPPGEHSIRSQATRVKTLLYGLAGEKEGQHIQLIRRIKP